MQKAMKDDLATYKAPIVAARDALQKSFEKDEAATTELALVLVRWMPCRPKSRKSSQPSRATRVQRILALSAEPVVGAGESP